MVRTIAQIIAMPPLTCKVWPTAWTCQLERAPGVKRTSAAVIRDGTRRLLEEPAFREAARGIALEIAAMPPAAYAAERLERAVLERQASNVEGSGTPVSV